MIVEQKTLTANLDNGLFTPSRDQARPKSGINTIEVDHDGIKIDPFKITVSIGAVAGLLVLTSIAVQVADYLTGYSSVFVHKLMKLTSVDLELNIPAFFSTLILLFSSMLLGVITFLKHRQKAPYVWHWALLSAGFLFMAFDETASIHERSIEPVRALLGEANFGILYFAWVVPAIILIPFLSIVFLKFFIALPTTLRVGIFTAAVLYLGGAVGFELIEGSHVEVYGKENLPYMALATIEETLEMAGIIVFIRTLLQYIADTFERLQMQFVRRPK